MFKVPTRMVYETNVLIVVCAPLSTKALIGWPFTSTGILERFCVQRQVVERDPRHSLEHSDASEDLRRILQRVLQILEDSLLLDCLLDFALSLNTKRVRF